MDYEKAYKAVLKTATQWIKDGCTDKEKIFLECVIPELRESEDERIRKAALEGIEYLERKLGWDAIGDTDILDVKEYLEKQKYDRMKPIYDARESFESALEKAWNDYHNGYENVDKLEDDYVECAHAKGFREGYLFCIEKQKEQNPAERSEEDEAILDSVIRIITHVDDLAHEPTFAGPKWTHPYTKEITWLKSLRPKPHWKPTEEQMEALKECGECKRCIKKLYEQLKSIQ